MLNIFISKGCQHGLLCRMPVLAIAKASICLFVCQTLTVSKSYDHKIVTISSPKDSSLSMVYQKFKRNHAKQEH